MAYDVFVSYSIKDRLLADALCHKLEEDNIRCWIAPRDISPGGSWAGEIADAIPNLRAVDFPGNLITDIGPIVDNITTLQSINLNGNLIKDLSPFESAKYPDLHNISLVAKKITDVSPLSAFINLKELDITSNNIEDLSPLLEIAELKALFVDTAQFASHTNVLNELNNRDCEVTIED